MAIVNSQGTGFTLNELNEELFCWTLICQLDSLKYQDLPLTLTSKILPSLLSSCKWCLGKGRTDQAKTHTLEQCTGLEASIEHFKSNKRTWPQVL
jgi:hypothetical protein